MLGNGRGGFIKHGENSAPWDREEGGSRAML